MSGAGALKAQAQLLNRSRVGRVFLPCKCPSRPARSLRMGSLAKLSQDELKQQAAWKAVEYVKSGMVLGLGTGSTAAFAVDRIGQLLKDGTLKDIIGVPTSIRTYEQALGTFPIHAFEGDLQMQ